MSGPNVDAGSSDPTVAAVKGTQIGSGGSGVWGDSITGAGVTGTSTSSVGVDAKTGTGPAALRAIHAGNGPGVHGVCGGIGVLGGGSGVWGDSDSGPGVSGTSNGSVGVDAKTQTGPAALRAIHAGNGPGVHGVCGGIGVLGGGSGVWGDSDSGPGVSGTSNGSVGVDAKTQTGPAALRAIHTGGGLAGFFEGNVVVTGTLSVAIDVILTGADCAEHFDLVQDAVCEPGTVMAISTDGALEASCQAYDKKVAGVVSGAGNFRTGIVLDRRRSDEERPAVALFGKVYCKVDAEYAPIEVGDLLTTSDTVGHAMKACDPIRAFGAVVGKALGNLTGGRELIPILITLQ